MLYLILYITGYILLFYFLQRRNKFLGSTSFVVLFYIVVGIASFYLYETDTFHTYKELTLFPFVYLFTMVFLMLYPGIRYERTKTHNIQCPSIIILQIFLLIYVICTLVILPKHLMNITDGLLLLFTSSSAGSELYSQAHQQVNPEGISLFGIFYMIHNILSEIAIFITFYYMSLPKKNKYLLILLYFSIIADIILPVANGLRTNCIMYALSLVLCYFMFRKYWTSRLDKIFRRISFALILLVSVPFMVLTISRFDDGYSGTSDSLISYVGQANLNFNNYCLDAGGIRNGDRTANYFKKIIGMDSTNGVTDTRMKYFSTMYIDDSRFYTFVGDFVLDYGPVMGAVVLLVFSWILILATRNKGTSIRFHQLLVIYLSLNIVLKGGMYLFTYSYFDNFILIAYFLMYVVLRLDFGQHIKHKYITTRIY